MAIIWTMAHSFGLNSAIVNHNLVNEAPPVLTNLKYRHRHDFPAKKSYEVLFDVVTACSGRGFLIFIACALNGEGNNNVLNTI